MEASGTVDLPDGWDEFGAPIYLRYRLEVSNIYGHCLVGDLVLTSVFGLLLLAARQ